MPSIHPNGSIMNPGMTTGPGSIPTPPTFTGHLASIIDYLGPTGMLCIGTVLWLLKRK